MNSIKVNSIKNLSEKRLALKEVNEKVTQLLSLRQDVVSQIATIKSALGYESNWDAAQEKYLFEQVSRELKKMSEPELFLISYMMESQASKAASYPAWSLGEHLAEPVKLLITEQINPILLMISNRSKYDSLNLTDSMRKKIEGI